jgi:hypothetical protein
MNAALITRGAGMESNYKLATHSLLTEWARWRFYQSGEVSGYPRQVPFYRLFRGASVSGVLITDDIAEKVDRAVSRIRQKDEDQARVLELYYLEHKTLAQIGEKTGVHRLVATERLRLAQNAVEWIMDPDFIHNEYLQ